ncbi:hypothetical protein NYO98_06565 [Nocardioides sp. STR2]|uniref:Uncharacterized protein n=1 Tax=Nocardioides pini TaxID=2975053 RepID=A0ABT4CCR1_9ACTN|nr:hypothetical protein [Nocardioides pini]MCY4725934.1 hypothetical protein [Nocardioides pini]
MDVSIGHLKLAGRVVGSRDQDPTPRVVDLLAGQAAREHLLAALTSAFDGDEVVVIRSLACTATLRADSQSAPTGLAGSVTASVARLLREHPTDDDCVVRFADDAAYVAAYVHDCLDGHAHRWYYDAFEPFRRRDGSADLAALLAAHRALRWRILARVSRHGDLDALLDRLGHRAADLVDSTGDDGTAWSALVTTAATVVHAAVGAPVPVDDRVVTVLSRSEPPPDWRDPASLGRAVAAATEALLPEVVPLPDTVVERLVAAARHHHWFDQEAFAAGIAARRAEASVPAEDDVAAVLSPRARGVLADLAEAAADPHLALDPRRPTSPRNLVELVTALVQAAPRWDDDDLARAVAAHVLRLWERRSPTPAPAHAATPVPPRRAAEAPPPGEGAGSAPSSPDTEVPQPRSPAGHASPLAPTPSAVQVARLLERRFPQPEPVLDGWEAATAGGLLLLRGAMDLGLSPYLLGRVGPEADPLLVALLRRWTGSADDDPVVAAVREAAGDPVPSGRLGDACRLAVGRLLGLSVVEEPLHTVTVPHGATGFAAVVADAVGHMLPWTGAELDVVPPPDDVTGRDVVADALTAVSLGRDGPDDLLLDLLAVSCVQAWARWLPGFARSSVPFLLSTFVRRPASVEVGEEDLTVLLAPRSHDIVLGLAGYLEPLDAGTTLGGRRIRFVTGWEHGT